MMNPEVAGRLQDHAFVLHSRAYQNTSLIVDVFTRRHGRIGLVAKGARRPASSMYGTLQPFHKLFLHWGGRGELKTLYTAERETESGFAKLDGEKIYLGFYINELMTRLLHHEEGHIHLFDSYQRCLEDLIQNPDFEAVLRYFELELLDELGYGLNLSDDYLTNENFDAGSLYIFHPERGLTLVQIEEQQDICLHGDTILALSGRCLDSDRQRREAKLLLRSIIEYHLNGRPLKTRELLQQRQRLQKNINELE